LPALTVTSTLVTNTGSLGWSRDWQALRPAPGVLVWAGGQDFWWGCDFCPITFRPVAGGGFSSGPGFFTAPYWRGSGGNGQLVAFDVEEPAQPRFASRITLANTNRWGFSAAFAANGLVYLSHQTVQYTNISTYRSFLDVVDYAEPGDPLLREPVNIPNPLVGIAHSGALLYSLGPHWNADPTLGWRDYLDASAYDGVAAHLVDSLPLPAPWPRPVLVLGTNVIVADPGDAYSTNIILPTLETWTLTGSGKFLKLGSLTLPSALSDLYALPGLVAANDLDWNINLLDTADPAKPRLITREKPPVCYWWPDLGHADGSLTAGGVWLPLGPYGVARIPAN
jgi:hypothetical protein